ncbi:MAG: hypothetical protein P8J33_17105 [Pirellulaceae bacterium]|jgi:DNA-binding beta-propeller fold protein YncE|nr:hypothetical protein [Pirellulaceae bacterium]
MQKLTCLFSLFTFMIVGSWVAANEVVSETVVSGLNNPCGVAIQPKTGHVFVANSGAGTICRIENGKAVPVITDFPIDVYGKGPKYNIGPLGLAFYGDGHLVVGGGGYKDGEELLRLYEVPAVGSSIKADAMVSSMKLAPTEEIKGEGNFYAVAVAGDSVFVSCNGDDTKGWVSKATIKDGKFSGYARNIATKEAVEVDAPVGLTIDPKNGHIVVGQMGEITVPGDGLLTFYSAGNGEMLANFETGLSDITSVAYDTKSYQMYALDFNWIDTKAGGLYHLTKATVDGEPGVECTKVMALDKATAMVIASDGHAYVTVIGTAEGDQLGGKLLKIKLPEIE